MNVASQDKAIQAIIDFAAEQGWSILYAKKVAPKLVEIVRTNS
jgi:hypothetical protein